MLRSVALGLVAAACGCLSVGMLVSTACITAPPPQLPAEVEHRPTILRDSVTPSGLVLSQLPTGGFIVPVVLEDPNQTFEWDIFIDYNACSDSQNCTTATPPRTPPGIIVVTPTPGTVDGGVVEVSFDSPTDLDPSRCHSIDFIVASRFLSGQPHTPDPNVGGDSVRWIWDPDGTTPCDLFVYDAGALQDGAFPLDAASESLPAIPESGAD
ncbi:MAG TPA: hypothetical protein VHS09_07660 [Polyangiaceae bacterium]|nr:hypothetical protein [Polyangiaceae bacterium]